MKRKRQTRLTLEERQKQLELSQTRYLKAMTGLVSLTIHAALSLQRRQDESIKSEQGSQPTL